MIKKSYAIYTTQDYTFDRMCESLLLQIGANNLVLKIVYFGSPQNNSEYISQLETLKRITKSHFPQKTPLVSYVAQKPMIGMLKAEVVYLESTEYVTVSVGENYLVLNNGICRELVTGGILPPDIFAPISEQSDRVFEKIEKILGTENFPINSIIRQWNYIENITQVDNGHQHYQDFNDSRSHFYAKAEWGHGYPAATGIGTQHGGIMVEVTAIVGEKLISCALDNPLQVSAHNYSQNVLIGETDPKFKQRTTPKFERGRVVGTLERQTIYISGTAAIRGELSIPLDDVTEQARMTMENIDYLISEKNYSTEVESQREYKMLRVYIKNPTQTETVRKYMNTNYPNIKKFYICADVCREELLLEIEGIAEVNFL